MAWIYLAIAGLAEIGWALALKQSDGFSRLVPSLVTAAFLAVSTGFLALALREIPIGTGYAIWTGIGAVGIAIVGIVWFGEPANLVRIGCIAAIVAGIAGLKLAA
jgi:quaternary ammonium compound-resistance protein SugE